MTLSNSQKTGILSTLLFHAIVLLLLLYFGFIMPYPLPQEEGFLVDFGNSATGIGLEEPSAAKAEVEVAEVKKSVQVTKPVTRPKPVSRSQDKGDEELLTQDYEKTVAVAAARAKKKLIDEEKRLKDLEERKLRAQALEQERREAEETRIQAEKAQKIGAINSRAKNAFGGGKADNGPQSKGQGNTYGSGNQGSPDGTPGANQYGLGGGTGSGKGPSYSLAGRKGISFPKPDFPGNEGGIVVVVVTVNRSGKVTMALPVSKGSTTQNADLWEEAKKAALKASFNSDEAATEFQRGTITYNFNIQ
jgi:colicin import membrane protein